jgi:hypothetical protein
LPRGIAPRSRAPEIKPVWRLPVGLGTTLFG